MCHLLFAGQEATGDWDRRIMSFLSPKSSVWSRSIWSVQGYQKSPVSLGFHWLPPPSCLYTGCLVGPLPSPSSPAALMLPAPEALLFPHPGRRGSLILWSFSHAHLCLPFSPVAKLPLNPPRCSWECYLKSPPLASSLKSWKLTRGNSEMAAQN